MQKKNINKIKKTFNKSKLLGKRYININKFFFFKILKNIEATPKKTRKWLFKRLAKKRLVINARFLFSKKQEKENSLSIDFLKNFFYKFEYPRLISINYYKLTDYHLELIRRLARKLFGKRVFIKLLITATKNLLKRANQMRMGGGKGGKFYKKIYPIYPGCSIIEFRGVSLKNINSFNYKLKKKLGFNFKVFLLNRI